MKIRALITLLLFPFYFHAQYLEVGLNFGASNYLGDLAPSSLWTSFGQTNLAKGIFVRYNLNNFVGFRLSLTHGVISASDEFSTKDDFRQNRNLSFRSEIYEAAILGEFNISGFQPEGKEKMISAYIFGGIAFFKFNPQTKFEDKWVDLQPLGTEGQGLPGYLKKYSLTQFSIPVGLGIKIAISENLTLAFETGTRKTFTDYLDDVSTNYPDLENLAAVNGELAAELSWRYDDLNIDAIPPEEGSGRGDSEDLDWYIFSNVTVSYNFIPGKNSSRNGKRRKRRSAIGCPVF